MAQYKKIKKNQLRLYGRIIPSISQEYGLRKGATLNEGLLQKSKSKQH